MDLQFKIFRFDPDLDSMSRFQNYTVTADPWERILDCLNRIKWEQDGTLGYRMSCGHGVCGSDAMKINGRCALACQKLMKDSENEKFLGPAPLVWAFRYVFDTRDDKTSERLEQLDSPDGPWGCVNHFECTRVCPKEIPVTKSINMIKREIQRKIKES